VWETIYTVKLALLNIRSLKNKSASQQLNDQKQPGFYASK